MNTFTLRLDSPRSFARYVVGLTTIAEQKAVVDFIVTLNLWTNDDEAMDNFQSAFCYYREQKARGEFYDAREVDEVPRQI